MTDVAAVAPNITELPLVKFDTSAVYDKYVGETEKRIRKVFQVAEGLAPCVLWIDELEKVFAGSGPDSASADDPDRPEGGRRPSSASASACSRSLPRS